MLVQAGIYAYMQDAGTGAGAALAVSDDRIIEAYKVKASAALASPHSLMTKPISKSDLQP